MVFASDGLWNVIEPESSVDSVYETERRNDHNAKMGINTWRNPSRILVETALEKWRSNGLRADNTSVVCVMLDPPNKRNMFKFCRTPISDCASTVESLEGARTIFDYSTSEAYNLDYAMGTDMYSGGGLTRQNASYDLQANHHPFYHQPTSNCDDRGGFQYGGSQPAYSMTGYNSYQTSYGYQTASTSSQEQNQFQNPIQPGSLTYQTSSNESAFVKACCRNNYLLANANEHIHYHSTYEQHREMYESMALRPYPPLHYAYRPVPTESQQLPLPSLHANLYDHQGYLQNSPNYKMERYNYLRPTPEEVAALHNEDEENDSGTDSDVMDFSDEESEDEEAEDKKLPTADSATEAHALKSTASEKEKRDDSIQIFEISSSSFHELDKTTNMETENTNDDNDDDGVVYKKKPAKSNNKENTGESVRRKKLTVAAVGRFYATRQTDRKMRSGNLGAQPGIQKAIGREKLQRRITRNIRKVVKSLSDQKSSSSSVKKFDSLSEMSRPKKIVAKNNESKPTEATKSSSKQRVLRSAQTKDIDSTIKKRMQDKCADIVRSLRSNTSSNNVMKVIMQKPATRKRTSAFFDGAERSARERRHK